MATVGDDRCLGQPVGCCCHLLYLHGDLSDFPHSVMSLAGSLCLQKCGPGPPKASRLNQCLCRTPSITGTVCWAYSREGLGWGVYSGPTLGRLGTHVPPSDSELRLRDQGKWSLQIPNECEGTPKSPQIPKTQKVARAQPNSTDSLLATKEEKLRRREIDLFD